MHTPLVRGVKINRFSGNDRDRVKISLNTEYSNKSGHSQYTNESVNNKFQKDTIQHKMKIQLALMLFAVFSMVNPFPLRINPECWKLYVNGFPFFGKQSINLSEMIDNHEKTGLGADHLAQSKIDFQQADKNENGILGVDEFVTEVMKNAEFPNYFERVDEDKDGLISISELKNYYVALKYLDPYISKYTLKLSLIHI